MRANTATAVRKAEGAIAQTAREEVRRVAQIGNTMAATGEATGMAVKTGLRELRLRTEAARRRFEPGYRAPDQRRLPGGVQAPLNAQAPEREAIPIDPRTGQPRRPRAQGFGRRDNYIQHYAPVQLQPPLRRDTEDGKVVGLVRIDAPEGGQGKPCGESFIPKNNKCSKKTGSSTNSNLQTVATVALAAGVLAGGTYLFKKKYFSKEEWDNHPANKLNNPKLTEAEAQRIVDEAIAGGQKWDAQEKINARRSAAECGGGLGKIQAPAKFDAAIPTPRCQAGEGAFGTYFVHPSEQYGIKLFRNGNEDDVASEFRRLDKADYAGVNVPSPLRMQAIRDADGEVRAQTLVLTHMKGYKTIDSEHGNAYGTAADAPLIVQRNIARQFRLLHTAGLAHGDIHSGNLMVNPRSRKVALIDFGYATELHDPRQSPHYRNGVQNLLSDMNRLPEFLGFSSRGTDFISRYKGVLSNVEKQAKELSSYGGRDNEERFQIAVKRYHDALETELLWDDRMPRSRFVSGADQPRIPGLTRRILTANANTRERDIMARDFVQKSTLFQQQAAALGVKRPRLFLALRPERDVRARQKPFGTPIPAVSTYKFGGPRRSTRSLQTPEYEWED